MDLVDLEMGMKFLSSQGHCLNVQEVTMLRASLSKLQSEEKYGKMYFWGKILGKKNDYYISYGLRENDIDFPAKKFYCATSDNFVFGEVPVITIEEQELISQFPSETVFSGEKESLLFPPKDENNEDTNGEENLLTELHRVAMTIEGVDHDTSVVPAEAYLLNDLHQVVPSPDYQGLSYSDLCELSSYAHLRPAENISSLRALSKDDVEWKNSNFLDRLQHSLPQGCWSKRADPSMSCIELRSLLWPGYAFFSIARKSYFGSVYIGHGLKNNDLPFLL